MVRDEPARPQERRIEVGEFAVKRADDVEAESVTEHAVREIKQSGYFLPVVVAAAQEHALSVFENEDFSKSGIAILGGPEGDDFAGLDGSEAIGRHEVEGMCRGEPLREGAQQRRLAGAGRAGQDSEAVAAAVEDNRLIELLAIARSQEC